MRWVSHRPSLLLLAAAGAPRCWPSPQASDAGQVPPSPSLTIRCSPLEKRVPVAGGIGHAADKTAWSRAFCTLPPPSKFCLFKLYNVKERNSRRKLLGDNFFPTFPVFILYCMRLVENTLLQPLSPYKRTLMSEGPLCNPTVEGSGIICVLRRAVVLETNREHHIAQWLCRAMEGPMKYLN